MEICASLSVGCFYFHDRLNIIFTDSFGLKKNVTPQQSFPSLTQVYFSEDISHSAGIGTREDGSSGSKLCFRAQTVSKTKEAGGQDGAIKEKEGGAEGRDGDAVSGRAH